MSTNQLVLEAINKCYQYLNENKFLQAKAISHQTIKVDPDCCEAHLILGICFLKEENYEQAKVCFLKSSELDSLKESSYNNLSVCFSKLGKYEESISYISKCLEINSEKDYYWSHLGLQYRKINLNKEAKKAFSKALRLNKSAINYANYAAFLADTNNYKQAKVYFEKSIKIEKDFAGPYIDLFHIYALQNVYNQKTWSYYEKRYDVYKQIEWVKKTNLNIVQNINDCFCKRNLIFCEQGLGDSIMFLRYLKEIPSGVNFKVLCKQDMNEVFKKMNIEVVNSLNDEKFDNIFSIMSLPFLLKVKKIPVSYFPLKSDIKKFNGNIGICWCGSPAHAHDRIRSLHYKQFEGIFKNEDLNVFSLVKNYSPRMYSDTKETVDFCQGFHENKKIIDLSSKMNSVIDTANQLITNNISLVITVDTMMAHLSASIGIETWLMLSAKPDWRWGLKNKSKWYGSNLKIFRQKKLNDWDFVVQKIKERLKTLLRINHKSQQVKNLLSF